MFNNYNLNKTSSKIAFGKSENSKKFKDDPNVGTSVVGGFVLGTVICGLMGAAGEAKSNKIKSDFIEKTTNLIESGALKDEVTIKDVTDDEKADFILAKKDGSRVILDVYNARILESKRKNVK